jgi:hypothetical protein
MTLQTQEAFFAAHADADGNLTDAQTMEMMFLPSEADTPTSATPAATVVESSAPAAPAAPVEPVATTPAATEPATPPAAPAAEPQLVVLARDGVHTIPFSELEAARTAQQTLAQQLAAAQAQLAALQATAPAPAPAAPAAPTAPTSAPAGEFEVDLGDFSEGALKDGIRKAVAAGVAAQTAALEQQIQTLQTALAPIQAQQVQSTEDAHFGSIRTAHPDVESVVPSAEFAKWRDAQPAFARAGIVQIIDGGTAAEVIEVLSAYKAAAGIKPVTPPPAPAGALPGLTVDAATAAAAAAVIAGARSPVPSSLSEIPAGSPQPADPTQAMLEMSVNAQMTALMNKTPAQIEALLARTL